MLGNIKVLENNVRDLYSMCHDELETKMTSRCYKQCQNLSELIQTLKQDVMFNALNQPSNKVVLSKMYDKLCHLESDLIELLKTMKPNESNKLNKPRVPKTIGSCAICQRSTKHQNKAGNSPHYSLPSRSRQMDDNDYDSLSDNINHVYERSFVDLEHVPRTRKVYRYPSIESFSSSSTSSMPTVWLEEYYVVPKKRNENNRIVRERLPFSVESNNHKVIQKRRKNSPMLRKPRNIPKTSVRKYYHSGLERSYKYIKQNPRRKKKKKRKNEDLKQGSEIYFVTKTKSPIRSGVNIPEGNGSPNAKYVVSRLRRIPSPADFNNGKSRVNRVKFMHRNREYPQSDRQIRCLSDSNSSQTSIESEFIRAKWRRNKSRRPMTKGPSFSQNSLKNYSILRSSCDDHPPEYSTLEQCNQISRGGKGSQRNNYFKTNPYNFKESLIVNSNYEVIDSFYKGGLNTQDCKPMKNKTKTPPVSLYHVRRNGLTNNSFQGASRNKRDISHLVIADQKNNLFSKTPVTRSLYLNEAPLYENRFGGAPPYKYSLPSSSWYPEGNIPRKVKPLRGQNKAPQNQVSVYQIHGKTQSNPFIKDKTNRKSSSAISTPLKESSSFLKRRKSIKQEKMSREAINPFIKDKTYNRKSSSAIEAPLKESSSFLKRRKSIKQNKMSREAIIHDIDYSNIKEGGDGDTIVSPRKYSSVAPVARTSEKGRLSKAGSKIKNLLRSVSKLKLKRQDTNNSVIDKSGSLSSFIQSDRKSKVESIYKQPTYAEEDSNKKVESIYKQPTYAEEDSNKLKHGLLGNSRLGRIPATSHFDKANQRHTTNSVDINKQTIKGLTYSLRYDKETRRDVECNHWPSTSSLNHFGSKCETLLSEEKIDLSEHKLNGLHNELHTYRIYPSTTDLANNNRKQGLMSPNLTYLGPNALDNKERREVDWKQIVNEIKEN